MFQVSKCFMMGCVTMLMAFALNANAATVQSWDINDVVTDSAPYVEFDSYYSTIYGANGSMEAIGGVTWKERDTQAPGLSVVTNDDVDGSNCIMSSGVHPIDGSTKQCSDPFQSSKRFKLYSTDNQPLYLKFNVTASDDNTYRILQKYSDYSPTRWQDFTIELGFLLADGTFVASTTNDGLSFSDRKGQTYTSTSTDQENDRDLSAFFSHGLFGTADKNHPEDGYFNPNVRAFFAMNATEDAITSQGISASYSDIFGEWLNEESLPTGIFWDDDNDPVTDNVLMANCDGDYDTINGVCNGTWVTYREYDGVVNGEAGNSDGVANPVSDEVLAEWATQPEIYVHDFIDDLANLGLTYHVLLGDNNQWPTPNSFVIRFTPVPVSE